MGIARLAMRPGPWVLAAVGWVSIGCAGMPTRRYERMSADIESARGAELTRGEQRAALPFSMEEPLDRAALVREVLRRSPDLEAARQAWRASLLRYPEATRFEDPMLEYEFAPLSIGSGVPFGQSIELSQRFPWPGKRALAGELALAEAEAERQGFEAARRSLAVMASSLYDRYFTSARSLEINASHAALVEQIRAAAQGQYAAGQGGQQELLQLELELAQVQRERLMLEAQQAELRAELNGLLRRAPELPLPPPPRELLAPPESVPSDDALRQQALAARSELRAVEQRMAARDTEGALMRRESYPELGVMTSYNSMWHDPEHRWMVGMSLSLPVQLGARGAAVERAEAERARLDAELAATTDRIFVEVGRARLGVLEAQASAKLYAERLLPTARAQIEAARIGYSSGQASFQGLIDAQRSLRSIELAEQEERATLSQRWAELDRAVGRLAGLPPEEQAELAPPPAPRTEDAP